jgi:hypothetical protein
MQARCRMIEIKTVSPGVLRLTVPEKLKADDFGQIAPQIESLIKQHGKIRLLIDATGFGGWELNSCRQIMAISSRCTSLSPSMYRWVVWIDR